MRHIVVGRVYFNGMAKLLKADGGIDDQPFCTTYSDN
jgi:hypothetical protein